MDRGMPCVVHTRKTKNTRKRELQAALFVTATNTKRNVPPTQSWMGPNHLRELPGTAGLGSSLPERRRHAVQPGGKAAKAIALFLEIPLENDRDRDA